MNKVSRTVSLLSFAMVVLIIASILVFGPNARQGPYVVVHDEVIYLTIADEKIERVRGLSGRDSLGPMEGMFFIFDTEDTHGIWMNDMNFAIDIVWLVEGEDSGELRVVDMERDVRPETFPDVFLPKEKALYVLEFFSGTTELLGLEVGDSVEIFLE